MSGRLGLVRHLCSSAAVLLARDIGATLQRSAGWSFRLVTQAPDPGRSFPWSRASSGRKG